jgi:hypothetical protein
METKPKTDPHSKKRFFTLSGALFEAQKSNKRIASAAEYEAIQLAALNDEVFDPATGKPAQIVDLFGGVAEWTTTKYEVRYRIDAKSATRLQDSRVLAGYGDPDKLTGLERTPDNKLIASPKVSSAFIGFRGVRTGTPRFIKP